MKTWTRIVGLTCTFALATACTVTVGKGNFDDSDDLDFTDKSEDPETTEDETSDTSSTRDTDETSTSSPTSSEPAPASTSAETSTSSDTSTDDTSTEEPGICAGEPEPDTCDECVNVSCEMEWQNCCATEGCVVTWMAIYSCVIENPSDDPWNDFDQCAAGASDTGDQIDLPVEVQDLYSCVNAPFMTDDGTDPYGWREQGDGTCTLLCYNIPSLDD